MRDCVFCKIVEGQEPAQVVRSWSDMIAFVPLNPVTEGHVLVVPRQHVEDARQVPWITGNAFMRAAQLSDGPCNLITSVGSEATQTVKHLHVHVVPRSADDGLALPWTPRRRIGWADKDGRWIGPPDSRYGVSYDDQPVYVGTRSEPR